MGIVLDRRGNEEAKWLRQKIGKEKAEVCPKSPCVKTMLDDR
jgi:hypothetical protein